jgi:hypothetical protein
LKLRILYCVGYILLCIGFDFAGDRINVSGLSSPWYPQAALSISLLLAYGWNYFWLVPLGKIISSIIVWPAPVVERIVPVAIFSAGIALLGFLLRRLRKSEDRPLLIYGLLSAALIAAICVPMAIFRQLYYHLLQGNDLKHFPSLGKHIWENWVGDSATIICLMPGMVKLIGPDRMHALRLIRKVGVEYWPVFLALFLLVLPVPFLPADLSHRAWYLFAPPCLALAAFAGLEAAVVITFVTNILVAAVAVAFLPRVNVIDLQIFLLSINLVSLILGAMVNESRERLEELSRAANLALEGQFMKVRALMSIQNTMLEPLQALVEEAEKLDSADLLSPVKKLLSGLDSLNQQERAKEIGIFPSRSLLEEWNEISASETPAGHTAPDLALAGALPKEIHCDRAALRTLFGQLVNLAQQIQAPNSQTSIFVLARGGNLLFRAEIKPSGAFSSKDVDFTRNTGHLPAGGYALTAFILHSFVRNLAGKMEISPHYFAFRDTLVVQIQLPLSPASEKEGP